MSWKRFDGWSLGQVGQSLLFVGQISTVFHLRRSWCLVLLLHPFFPFFFKCVVYDACRSRHYLHICMGMLIHPCACVCRLEFDAALTLTPLFFLRWNFSLKLNLIISATPFWLDCLVSELPISAFQALGYRHTARTLPACYVYPGDINSSSYDCTARSPPTEPSPGPHFL